MSESKEPMDFRRAEPMAAAEGQPESSAGAPMVCAQCGSAIRSEYYLLSANNKSLCAACSQAIQRAVESGESGSFGAAFGLGLAAAVVGAGIYYAVLTLFSLEVGLLALFIGYAVGRAVRKGAGLKRHWGFRAMALVLTYLSIVATYVPLIHAQLEPGSDQLLQTLGLAAMLPVLMAFDGEVLSLFIIAIGLWQAFLLSRAPQVQISGPFKLGAGLVPGENRRSEHEGQSQ